MWSEESYAAVDGGPSTNLSLVANKYSSNEENVHKNLPTFLLFVLRFSSIKASGSIILQVCFMSDLLFIKAIKEFIVER